MPGAASRQALTGLTEQLEELARETSQGVVASAVSTVVETVASAVGRDTDASPGGAGFGAVAESLFQVGRLLGREAGLRRALTDPSRADEDRVTLVDRVLGERIDANAMRIVRELVKARWSDQGDLAVAARTLGAQALFIVAEDEGRLDDVEDELFRFNRVVEREPRLRAALSDPALPVDRKNSLLESLVGDRVRPQTLRLLQEAIVTRGTSFDRTIESFSQLAAARRERSIARVRSAVPLSDDQQQRLAESLTRQFGRQIHLQVEVDPSVMGGLAVRVGDEVIDSTVARRLEEVRRRFVA